MQRWYTEMRDELCEPYLTHAHTHTHTHTHTFWRTLEEFHTSVWSALVRVQSDLQDNGFFSALCTVCVPLSLSWVYITEALYKSIHVSLCLRYNDTLYISCAREFLQYNLFNSRTCEGVQRSRRTAGLKKEHADRDHIHGETNKKQLFILWWWCFVANVSDHMESGLSHQSNYRLFSHASGGVQGTAVRSVSAPLWSGLKNVSTYLMDCHEILCRHNLQRINPNGFGETLIFVVFSEMSWQLLDGLPWNLMHIFRMNCNNFGDPLASIIKYNKKILICPICS